MQVNRLKGTSVAPLATRLRDEDAPAAWQLAQDAARKAVQAGALRVRRRRHSRALPVSVIAAAKSVVCKLSGRCI